MEDALVHKCAQHDCGGQLASLNPCFNGRCTRTGIPLAFNIS